MCNATNAIPKLASFVVAVIGLLAVAGGSAAAEEWSRLFPNAPREALVRKLTCAAEHAWRSGGEPNVALIEHAAAHPGTDVTLVDLTLDLGRPKPDAGYSPLTYRDDTWYGSTYWTGPDWTRVGKDWHHPGENTPSVRCWRAPRDGRITVRGPVRKLHLAGDGVRASILHNQREVWKTEIAGTDDKGIDPGLTLDVRQGDAIRFIVHKRGGIACDTTHWDPAITYAQGETFQASQAFGTKQGQGGWFYEMVGGADVTPPTLVVYTLRLDLSLSESPVASHADAFPLIVIADGNRSGVVLTFESTGPWNFRTAESSAGVLRITLSAKPEANGRVPTVRVHAYEGPWTTNLPLLKRHLADRAAGPYGRLVAPLARKLDLDLFLMAQAEWRLDDKITETVTSYAAAVADHLQRAQGLEPVGTVANTAGVTRRHAAALAKLAEASRRTGLSLADWRGLYLQTRLLKRDLALSHPLLNIEQLLLCKRVPPSYSHLVGQYFGWRQRPGGGLFVLEQPGCSLAVRDIVGRQLPAGSFLEPRLSYDGRRIAFSFVACPAQPPSSTALPVNEHGDEAAYFHIHEINVDGSGLRQLTSGCYDDMMPCYLPDGGLAFVSTRRRSYSRCFGPNFSNRWHSYTLHRMNADGSEPRILSLNDVNEWFPSVAHTGEILFARWDYIDRDAVTHQNLWSMRPDGTNPIAVWGNATPKPHCTFQAKAIPGSRKIVFIASAHHALTGGPVCVLDAAVDPNSLAAVTRITPGPFPEAEGGPVPEYYESPWPLSEKLFLVAYSRDRLIFEGEHGRNPNPDNALGLYLLDAAGNRELLYRDPQISSTNPIPLRPQAAPLTLPSSLPPDAPPMGEMLVTDIYQGLGAVPRGSIKELRIVQIFPKTTWIANSPRIGVAGEENARAILGTVPVEPDGSARFLVPAHKPILFQALDQHGFAYQTMRSTTYVQPGERTSCVGCHEHRMSAPTKPDAGLPLAMRRAPSKIAPGEWGGRPFGFAEVVQPVLDRHCVRCHGGEKTEKGVDLTGTPHNGFTKSYWSLCEQPVGKPGAKPVPAEPLVPRFAQRNQIQTTPAGGAYGALGSRLMKLLRAGHEEEKLSDHDLRRLAAWIDCNAVFYGSFDPAEQAKQLANQPIAMPEIQ